MTRILLLVLVFLALPAVASAQRLIVVDPGHGGSDPGAVGCGLHEAPMALDVSKRLVRLLEDLGLRARLTRSDDSYVSLSGRATFANSLGADRFVSIHENAHTSDASGTETFMYTSGSANSRDMRDRIQRAMLRAWMLPDRGGKTANFAVLRETSMPATLSELGFITRCSPDAELIGDPDARQAAAQAHLNAIAAHLGIDVPPPTPTEGTLTVVVFEDVGLGEEDTSRRLPGATVTVVEAEVSADAAAETGEVPFMLPVGSYTVRASLDGYETAERTCALEAATATCAVGLVPTAAEVDAGATVVPESDGGTMPVTTPPGREPKDVGGCSAAGGGGATAWWALLAVLGLGMRRRRAAAPARRRIAVLAVAVALSLALLAGCERGTDRPAAAAAALDDTVSRPPAEEEVTRPATEAVEATTVEAFATLSDDLVVAHEELAGAFLSPDGARLAVSRPGFRGLSILDLAAGGETLLTEDERAGWRPVWREDSLAIGYRAPGQTGSAVPLRAVTVDGAEIAPFAGTDGVHFVERDERIVRLSAGGRSVVVSPDVGGERFIAPMRSSDGAFVVFLGLHTGLYVHRVRDGRTVALGPGTDPSFSADGQWLVFARTVDDGHRITASDLYLAYLGYDAVPTGRLTDTPDRIEMSPSLDGTASRVAFLDQADDSVHVATLTLTDATALDDPDAPGAVAPHFHLPNTPPHTHPHASASNDPWHLVLGHE